MSEKEKPLPKPPNTPFGKKRRFEETKEDVPLMADQMAAAMAEGKLNEFLQKELPDNEYAVTLARMMMGMTGMLPPEGLPSEPDKKSEERSEVAEEIGSSQSPPAAQPPEDVLKAVHSGDVEGLMGLLEREHKKRMPDTESVAEEKGADNSPGLTPVEKETIEKIMKIASDNKLSVDWVVLRALQLYAQEYQRTGRL